MKLSAKDFIKISMGSLSSDEDHSGRITYVTAFGIIEGTRDLDLLESLEKHAVRTQKYIPNLEIEEVTEPDVIALKDVVISPSGNPSAKISVPSMFLFGDQVIAVYVPCEILNMF